MKTIELTKGYTTLVADEDFERVKTHSWQICGDYAVGYVDGKSGVMLHKFIMGAVKGMEVDHINGNPLDNRRENLRVCTTQENRRNRRNRRTTLPVSRAFTSTKRLVSGW